jgi:ATP-dependent DNA helicase RecG
MPITSAQIDVWRAANSEHQNLEFKEAKLQYDSTKLCKYCVALANEGGGYFVLGIEDKPPRKVVGTIACSDPVAMAAKLFEILGFRVDVEVVQHPDGRVVVFRIPSRPRGTAFHYEGAYLMRSGEELRSMSEDRLRAIFAEGQPDWLEESAMTGCTDEKVIELIDTQGYFDLLSLAYPSNRLGVLERLEHEKIITPDADGWTITNLGAMLFAKDLNSFESVARKAPRVIVYEGNGKGSTKLDRRGLMGYAVGFQGLIRFINSLVPSNEVIEQALRREVKMFPEIAIRELVANAIVHQDFKESGTSLIIEIYSDRLEISNPGKPFIPVDRFIDEYQSRNERLADVMRRLGICEEKGSGIDKVIQAAEVFQLPAPDIRAGVKRTTVVLFAHKRLDDMNRNDRIRACYQHCALRYVMNETASNQSFRERLKLPESKVAIVSQIITATVDAGRIKIADPSQTSTRYRTYIPYWA